MAVKRKLARGDINVKNGTGWSEAELFWEAKTDNESSRNKEFNKWDEGTLWIGRPSLSDSKESPIPIGGARSVNSFVYRGTLSTQVNIKDSIFLHARKGDVYIWSTDATGGNFKDIDDFRTHDLLLITDSTIDPNDGKGTEVKYTRIVSSGGWSDDMYFFNNKNNGETSGENWQGFDSNNVQDALIEEHIKKLHYCGTIPLDEIDAKPISPVIGGLYLVTKDRVTFNNQGEDHYWTSKKGDFAIWTADSVKDYKAGNFYWHRISSGYTNAEDIDYYDESGEDQAALELYIKDLHSTFKEDHKRKFKDNSKNVKDVLDFLMANKAQLDEQGKVPLSQLHDTILGGIQYRGTWSPITKACITAKGWTSVNGISNVTDPSYLNRLPGYSSYEDGDTETPGIEQKPSNGDYYIITLPPDCINLQYSDGSTNFELNVGDWIIFTDSDVIDTTSPGTGQDSDPVGHWSILDNSERLTGLTFRLNSIEQGSWISPTSETEISLVGQPTFKSSHKIGLMNETSNEGGGVIEIVGQNLLDQSYGEFGKYRFYPRYKSDESNTVENALLKDSNESEDPSSINKISNTTETMGNFQVGSPKRNRTLSVYGDSYVFPQPYIEDSSSETKYKKSNISFITSPDSTSTNVVSVYAQSGLTKADFGVDEKPAEVTPQNIFLPEKTSTIVGMLSGVNFIKDRVTKSTTDGYIESTSIEEHKNTSDVDNFLNVVEFHSQISSKNINLTRVSFGNFTNEPDDSFDSRGDHSSPNNVTNVYKNFAVTTSVQDIYLPKDSGVLVSNKNLDSVLSNKGSEFYFPFWNHEKLTLDSGKELETHKTDLKILDTSPIKLAKGELLSRLQKSKEANPASKQTTIDKVRTNSEKDSEVNYATKYNSDITVERDVVVGKTPTKDDDGTRSLFVTKSVALGNSSHSTGALFPPRTNFSEAVQYYNPYNGTKNPESDVYIDMPNESGVMLTSNSVIDGGYYSNSTKNSYQFDNTKH